VQFVAVELDGRPKRESDIGHVRVIPLSQAGAVKHEMGRGADGCVKYDWNSSSVLVGSPRWPGVNDLVAPSVRSQSGAHEVLAGSSTG
jgi:hypothetical protein